MRPRENTRLLAAWRCVRLSYLPLLLLSAIPYLFVALTSELDVTGPASAKTAILVIYDIFGFFPQTLQGADILANSDKNHTYQVFMPDFFEGEPADIAW